MGESVARLNIEHLTPARMTSNKYGAGAGAGAGHSDYEHQLPQIIPKPRQSYADKPELIRSLKRQCCLQVFLSLIVTLAVAISFLLLFLEVSDSASPPPPAPWSQWSSCTRTCGGGFQLRSRQCPAPRILLWIFRKHECWYTGESAEIRQCNTQICSHTNSIIKEIFGEDYDDDEGDGSESGSGSGSG